LGVNRNPKLRAWTSRTKLESTVEYAFDDCEHRSSQSYSCHFGVAIHDQVDEGAKRRQVADRPKRDAQQSMPRPQTLVFSLYAEQLDCLGVAQLQELIMG